MRVLLDCFAITCIHLHGALPVLLFVAQDTTERVSIAGISLLTCSCSCSCSPSLPLPGSTLNTCPYLLFAMSSIFFLSQFYTSTKQQLQQENLLLDHMMKCSAVSTETEPSILQPSPSSSSPPSYASPRNKKRDDEKPHGMSSPNPSPSVPSLLHLSDDSSSSHITGETSISSSRVDSSSDDTYTSAAAIIQSNQSNVHIRMTKSKKTSHAALATSEFSGTVGSANLSRPNMVRAENPMQDQEEEASGVNKKKQTYSCNMSDVCTISEGRNYNYTGTSSRTLSPTLQGMSSSTSILEEERSDPRNNPSASAAAAARQNQKKHTTTKDVEHSTGLNHSPGTQALALNPAEYLKRKGNETGVLEGNLNLPCMKTSTAHTRTTSSVISTTLKTGIRAGEKHSLDVRNERQQLKRRSARPACTAECPICMRVFHTTVSDISRLPSSLICISSYRSKMFYNFARALFWLLPDTIDEILDRDQSTHYELLRPTRAHGVKNIKITR
eukprot:scaffold46830_cov62-Attheya_sp.AAC.3